MNNKNIINGNLKKLNPLGQFCINLGMIPTSYTEAMTYEEQILWLCNFYDTEILPVVNNNTELTQEAITQFNELYNYTHNYFNNLDIQDEINNKLDQMAADGTLEAIISKYIKTIEDSVKNSYIYDEIETTEFFNETNNTHYYVTHVPNKDKNGNLIKLKHGFAKDNTTAQCIADETARSFSKRHANTFTINASIYGVNPQYENYNHILGLIINNGQVISNYNFEGIEDTSQINILGVLPDNTLKVYPNNTSATTILNDGVETTFVAFNTLMQNGVILTESESLYQWNILGQNTTTKDFYFICCNGKDINSEKGMSQLELVNILKSYGCDFAYRLDQGGSTSLIHNHIMINQPSDNYGRTERLIPDYIYFGKELQTTIDYNVNEMYKKIGDNKNLSNNAMQKGRYFQETNVPHTKWNNLSPTYLGGMQLEYVNNGTEDSAIVLSPNAAPKSLNIYDMEQDKTILRINPLTKLISFENDNLASIFEINKVITDINDVTTTGIVGCPGTTANIPVSGINFIVFTLRTAQLGYIQIAIPCRQNMTLTPLYIRYATIGNIGAWYKFPDLISL